MQAIELAKRGNVRVSFDGGADRFKPEMKALVPLTDICIVARDFAEKYTGKTEPLRSAKSLLEEGPGIAIVTDGVNGSWICTKESPFTSLRSFSPKLLIQQAAAIVITEPSSPPWSRDSLWRNQL